MKYFNAFFGWIWRNKLFVSLVFASAGFFTVWNFPFNDLSDAVTSAVARGTNNQIYMQADQLNIHLIPQPAVSADGLRIETALPPLEAKWAKITPGLFSILFNIPTMIKAAGGNPEAARNLFSRLSLSVDAEKVLGGDVSLDLGSGKKGEGGGERQRVTLDVDQVSLKEVGAWADLPVALEGRASLATDMQVAPDFSEQPEGEYELKIAKFRMPAGTVTIPMGEAAMPLNLPNLTLANVNLRGRLVGGNFIIEEGMFGQSQDPLYGRIKGSLGLRILPGGSTQIGSYNLTVDLTTSASLQKELGFVFLLLDNAKEPQPGGGAKYLFRASGAGIGLAAAPPSITRVPSF